MIGERSKSKSFKALTWKKYFKMVSFLHLTRNGTLWLHIHLLTNFEEKSKWQLANIIETQISLLYKAWHWHWRAFGYFFALVFFIIHLSLKLNLNKMYGKKLNMYKLFPRMNKEVCKAKTFISISAQKYCCLLS